MPNAFTKNRTFFKETGFYDAWDKEYSVLSKRDKNKLLYILSNSCECKVEKLKNIN